MGQPEKMCVHCACIRAREAMRNMCVYEQEMIETMYGVSKAHEGLYKIVYRMNTVGTHMRMYVCM